MRGFERDHFQNQQVEGALDEVRWFAQFPLLSVTDNSLRQDEKPVNRIFYSNRKAAMGSALAARRAGR
jgi:hypothetical protein